MTDDQNVDALIRALSSDDSEYRRKSARRLNQFRNQEVITALISSMLNDPNNRVRWTAAWSLAIMGHEDAIEPLKLALLDSDRHVQYQVALAIGVYPHVAFVVPLITNLHKKNFAAAETLLKFNHLGYIQNLTFDDLDVAYKLLRLGFTGVSPKIRANSACAMARYGDERVIDWLIDSLMDADEVVRLHCIRGLVRLGNKRAIQPLQRLLEYVPEQKIIADALGILTKGLES